MIADCPRRVPDRVVGLDLGADDYLTAVQLRGVAALYRATALPRWRDTPTTLQVASVELDLVRRTATAAGRPVELTARSSGWLRLCSATPVRCPAASSR